MMKRKLSKDAILAGTISLTASPLLVSAASPSDFKGVVLIMVDVIKAALPILVLLSFIYFFWGLAKYIKEESGKKEEAKQIIVWGLIAFFAMSGLWGIMTILTNTFIPTAGTHMPSGTSDTVNTDWMETVPEINTP